MRYRGTYRLSFGDVHVGALALSVIFLPWSTAFLSIAQMLLVANWIAWGIATHQLRAWSRRSFTEPTSVVFLSFLGIHLMGLLWTSDEGMAWGLDLVRILLPVLTFGVVLSSAPPLSGAQLRGVLLLGAWSVVASTLACTALAGDNGLDYRARSLFISHIRLALLLCISVVFLLRLMPASGWGRLLHIAATAWAVHYITVLGSMQGMFILALIGAITLWQWAQGRPAVLRHALRVFILVTLIGAGVLVAALITRTPSLPEPERSGWGHYTTGGEPYTFDSTNPQQENGHHVWAWIAWGEVERTWPLRSALPLDGPDALGRPLRGTLVRYMTSLDIRKDSAGIMTLEDRDVRAIESGVVNAHDAHRGTLSRRWHEVLNELDLYRTQGSASGHSVAMRLEFWRTGLAILAEHPWSGVGTGDTQPAFDAQYERMNSQLEPQWRLRAHQQFLTWGISFGIVGALWCLIAIGWPSAVARAWADPLFMAWAVAFGVSCLTDDTVETQAGATFFALYYCLFVFGVDRRPPILPQGASPAPGPR